MRRSRIPFEERLKQLHLIKEREREEEARRKAYNKIFRKGRFFIGVTVVRVVFVATFIAVCFLHFKTGSMREETIESAGNHTYTNYTKHGSYTETEVSFRTDVRSYSTTLRGETGEFFEKGDKVLIERNVFGRAIAFTKAEWSTTYYLKPGIMFYWAVFFITFISAFFHDGTARFVLNFLKIIVAMDVIALAAYFLDLY